MRKIIQILKKDLLLLLRDKTGLSFLFGMPIAMVLIMTMLQDSSLKALQNEKVDILILNNDSNIVGDAIIAGLDSASIFNIYLKHEDKVPSLEEAKELVACGEYKMGLIIPKKTTRKFRKVISREVKKQMPVPGMSNKRDSSQLAKADISMFFDPVIKASFRQAMNGTVREIIANIQTQMVFKSYTKVIERLSGKKNEDMFPHENFLLIETAVGKNSNAKLPNSTEHNVPAWAIFAIFFIVVPLSGQMIAESTNGTTTRLKTIPTLYMTHMLSKTFVYTAIAVAQFLVLLVIGRYVLPLLGLPVLNYNSLWSIIVVTIFIGLAATTYALAVGTIAKTHNQASIFGSISVVIFAAIGGIWVPMFMMSDTMHIISEMSPLNWSLTAYSKLFLQEANIIDISPELIKLFVFSVLSLTVAVVYEKVKSR